MNWKRRVIPAVVGVLAMSGAALARAPEIRGPQDIPGRGGIDGNNRDFVGPSQGPMYNPGATIFPGGSPALSPSTAETSTVTGRVVDFKNKIVYLDAQGTITKLDGRHVAFRREPRPGETVRATVT